MYMPEIQRIRLPYVLLPGAQGMEAESPQPARQNSKQGILRYAQNDAFAGRGLGADSPTPRIMAGTASHVRGDAPKNIQAGRVSNHH